MTLGSQSDLMSNNPTTNNQWWRHMLNHKHFVMRPSSWQLPFTKMRGCRTVHTGSQGESAKSGWGLLHGNSKAFLKASCREQYHSYLERKKSLTGHRKSFVMDHVGHLICSIQNTPRQPASYLTPHEANRSDTASSLCHLGGNVTSADGNIDPTTKALQIRITSSCNSFTFVSGLKGT